jgi:Reverse transcriptase (RNA-dependent DNA polymerase)
MFFGMCNSPATFQAMMDSICSDMIKECIVIIYMDDILIFANRRPSKTYENGTATITGT